MAERRSSHREKPRRAKAMPLGNELDAHMQALDAAARAEHLNPLAAKLTAAGIRPPSPEDLAAAPPPPAEAAPSRGEAVAQAPAAPEEAPPAPERSEADKVLDDARDHYRDLSKQLHAFNVSSNDIPVEWKAAHDAFMAVDKGAALYERETDPGKKAAILEDMKRNASYERWEALFEIISAGLDRLDAKHSGPPQEAPAAPSAGPAKPAPRERARKEKEPKPEAKSGNAKRGKRTDARPPLAEPEPQPAPPAQIERAVEPDSTAGEMADMTPAERARAAESEREKIRKLLARFDQHGLEDDRVPPGLAEPARAEETLPAAGPAADELPVEPPTGMQVPKERMSHVDERMRAFQEKLALRSKELDKKAEGLGPAAERLVRSIGERYNRLGWKKKLLIGGTLAAASVGASVATGGASIWWTFGILSGYRAVAGAGMFVAAESMLQRAGEKQERWWNKHPKAYAAAAAALVASGLVGKGIGAGAHSVVETEGGRAVTDWLKAHMPLGGGAPGRASLAQPPSPMPTQAPHPPGEYIEPPAGAAHAALPVVSVEPKSGYGYEAMVKDLWRHLQERHLNPNEYPAGSDLHRLLIADEKSIDRIVHQIAADPARGFVHTDGSSAVVEKGARLTLDPNGALHLYDSHHPGNAQAAGTIRSAPPAPHASTPGSSAEALNKAELERINAGLPSSPGHAVTAPPPEAPRAAPGYSGGEAALGPETAPPPPGTLPPSFIMSSHNIPIDPRIPGVYAGPDNQLVAYGGPFQDRLEYAQNYANANPGAAVLVPADESGQVVLVRRAGFLRRFFGGGPRYQPHPGPVPNPRGFTHRVR